jgi:16S rRNA (adenine1518-N6/adenine1519-N6)-dimethyltransferase
MVSIGQLQSLGINDGLRPENLGLTDYVAIADLLFEEKGAASTANEVSDD